MWDLLATEQQTHREGGGWWWWRTLLIWLLLSPPSAEKRGVRCSYNADPCDPTHPASRTSVAANPLVGTHICGCWVLFISSLIFLPWNERTGVREITSSRKDKKKQCHRPQLFNGWVPVLHIHHENSHLKSFGFFCHFQETNHVLWGERGGSYSSDAVYNAGLMVLIPQPQ